MQKLIFILIFVTTIPAIAQTDRIDSLLNDLIYNDADPMEMPEKPVKFDFMYAGTSYNSNTFYAGREISTGMYNISGYLFYYNSTGLFIGTSGSWFDQLTPSYSNTTLSVGFSKGLGKKKLFTVRTSYSRFIYYKPDPLSIYPYNNNFSLGFSFRKNWIGIRTSSGLLFGDDTKINLSTALYSRFTLLKFGKYNKIYTAPEISAYFSTETIAVKPSGTNDGSQTTTNMKDVFGLLNTQFYVPLGFSVGNFDLEFSYYINIPTTQDAYTTYSTKSFYSVTVGYLLPIMK